MKAEDFNINDKVELLNHGDWRHLSVGKVVEFFFTKMKSYRQIIKIKMDNGVEIIVEPYYLRKLKENK